jgi:hypothetical protein
MPRMRRATSAVPGGLVWLVVAVACGDGPAAGGTGAAAGMQGTATEGSWSACFDPSSGVGCGEYCATHNGVCSATCTPLFDVPEGVAAEHWDEDDCTSMNGGSRGVVFVCDSPADGSTGSRGARCCCADLP